MDTSSSDHYIVRYVHIFIVLPLVSGSHPSSELLYYERSAAASNQTATVYNVGVRVGIIDPEKYSLESFQEHQKLFKSLHKKYNEMKDVEPINYGEWLLLNNYGILHDTQESILQLKKKTLATNRYKKAFTQAVMKGDILITQKRGTGILGHVGMMATDKFAIEMAGGKGWFWGIEDNNRRLSSDAWFEEYSSRYTSVYRCLNKALADKAGKWAYRNYYNPKGGDKKTIQITYRITPIFESTNPSYCSKQVLQAFYYTDSSVINSIYRYGPFIIPVKMPYYFNSDCNMIYVGKY